MNKNHIAEVIELLKDGEAHELYELNQRYRLTLAQSRAVITALITEGIVEGDGKFFALKKTLTKNQITYLYKILRKRDVNLEAEVIAMYNNQSIGIDEMYSPKIEMLSSELIVDDKNR